MWWSKNDKSGGLKISQKKWVKISLSYFICFAVLHNICMESRKSGNGYKTALNTSR